MSNVVLDERTAQTPVGDLLSSDTGDVVEFYNESGRLVGRLLKGDSAESEREESSQVPDPAEFEARFRRLAEEWIAATSHLSSPSDIAIHPAYQQIIGMGKAAVPLILEELAREPDQWFWALKSITGEDPVPPADRGRIDRMAAVWIAWGSDRGLIR